MQLAKSPVGPSFVNFPINVEVKENVPLFIELKSSKLCARNGWHTKRPMKTGFVSQTFRKAYKIYTQIDCISCWCSFGSAYVYVMYGIHSFVVRQTGKRLKQQKMHK